MIKFDKNEFLKPQIYSTLDEYETRCNVTKEIIKDFEQLQQENKQLKDNWNKLKAYLNDKSERAVGEDEYIYDEIYNEMQELEQGSDK